MLDAVVVILLALALVAVVLAAIRWVKGLPWGGG